MSDDQLTQSNLLSRMGNFFRRALHEANGDWTEPTTLSNGMPEDGHVSGDSSVARTTFLRPWNKREQAIDQLQSGIAAVSDLMGTIRDTLERSSTRQDELLNYLAALPRVVE